MDNPFRIQQQAEAVRRMVRDTARNRMGLPPVWTDDTQPRTDRPIRFANLPISGTLSGNTKSFTFRLYYTR